MSKLFNKQNFNVAKEFVSTIKNKLNKKNSTISSVKTNVPKTKLDKANSNLDIAIHKNKASKAIGGSYTAKRLSAWSESKQIDTIQVIPNYSSFN